MTVELKQRFCSKMKKLISILPDGEDNSSGVGGRTTRAASVHIRTSTSLTWLQENGKLQAAKESYTSAMC